MATAAQPLITIPCHSVYIALEALFDRLGIPHLAYLSSDQICVQPIITEHEHLDAIMAWLTMRTLTWVSDDSESFNISTTYDNRLDAETAQTLHRALTTLAYMIKGWRENARAVRCTYQLSFAQAPTLLRLVSELINRVRRLAVSTKSTYIQDVTDIIIEMTQTLQLGMSLYASRDDWSIFDNNAEKIITACDNIISQVCILITFTSKKEYSRPHYAGEIIRSLEARLDVFTKFNAAYEWQLSETQPASPALD